MKRVDALPDLTHALSDEDADVRYWAAFALGRIGPPAKAVTPALRARIDDPEQNVREQVRKSLEEIDK